MLYDVNDYRVSLNELILDSEAAVDLEYAPGDGTLAFLLGPDRRAKIMDANPNSLTLHCYRPGPGGWYRYTCVRGIPAEEREGEPWTDLLALLTALRVDFQASDRKWSPEDGMETVEKRVVRSEYGFAQCSSDTMLRGEGRWEVHFTERVLLLNGAAVSYIGVTSRDNDFSSKSARALLEQILSGLHDPDEETAAGAMSAALEHIDWTRLELRQDRLALRLERDDGSALFRLRQDGRVRCRLLRWDAHSGSGPDGQDLIAFFARTLFGQDLDWSWDAAREYGLETDGWEEDVAEEEELP